MSNDLSELLAEELSRYSRDLADGMIKLIDKVADETKKDTKADIKRLFKKKSGNYEKGVKSTVTYLSDTEKKVTVHNKEYRRGHLLENDHAIVRNNIIVGRYKGRSHMKPNEENAIQKLENGMEDLIKNGR